MPIILAVALLSALAGRVSVIDADTLDLHGARIRLWGIDAPESRQLCQDRRGRDYRCGQVAANALDAWIADRPVRCEARDHDRYGRTVASCSVSGQDMGAWLVRRGYAVEYRRYSRGAYRADEDAAKADGAGLWAGRFEWPWNWRADRR